MEYLNKRYLTQLFDESTDDYNEENYTKLLLNLQILIAPSISRDSVRFDERTIIADTLVPLLPAIVVHCFNEDCSATDALEGCLELLDLILLESSPTVCGTLSATKSLGLVDILVRRIYFAPKSISMSSRIYSLARRALVALTSHVNQDLGMVILAFALETARKSCKATPHRQGEFNARLLRLVSSILGIMEDTGIDFLSDLYVDGAVNFTIYIRSRLLCCDDRMPSRLVPFDDYDIANLSSVDRRDEWFSQRFREEPIWWDILELCFLHAGAKLSSCPSLSSSVWEMNTCLVASLARFWNQPRWIDNQFPIVNERPKLSVDLVRCYEHRASEKIIRILCAGKKLTARSASVIQIILEACVTKGIAKSFYCLWHFLVGSVNQDALDNELLSILVEISS